jgi:hypothetical protein
VEVIAEHVRAMLSKISPKRFSQKFFFSDPDTHPIPTAFAGTEYEQDIILFRRVLDRALSDMFSKNPKIQNEVIEWLDPDSEGFAEACINANLDIPYTYTIFQILRMFYLEGK